MKYKVTVRTYYNNETDFIFDNIESASAFMDTAANAMAPDADPERPTELVMMPFVEPF